MMTMLKPYSKLRSKLKVEIRNINGNGHWAIFHHWISNEQVICLKNSESTQCMPGRSQFNGHCIIVKIPGSYCKCLENRWKINQTIYSIEKRGMNLSAYVHKNIELMWKKNWIGADRYEKVGMVFISFCIQSDSSCPKCMKMTRKPFLDRDRVFFFHSFNRISKHLMNILVWLFGICNDNLSPKPYSKYKS